MRAIVLLTAALAVGAWFVVRHLPTGTAEAAPMVVTSHQVLSISIDGTGLPIAALRNTMTTKIGTELDDAVLEADRRAMQESLVLRGYLSAAVESPIVTFGGGGVYVVFDIDRGPLYQLGEIRLVGPSWGDAGVVTLASGDEALGVRLAQARQAAQETLSRHGKQIAVELVLYPDREAEMVDIELVTR